MESEECVFWLGGDYEDLGTFKSKEDAERGIGPNDRLTDLLHEFKGKKVKLKIEVIEE